MFIAECTAQTHGGVDKTFDGNLQHVQQIRAFYDPAGRGRDITRLPRSRQREGQGCPAGHHEATSQFGTYMPIVHRDLVLKSQGFIQDFQLGDRRMN